MSETLPTMSETVEVDVDQVTAFKVFTEEFDEWWGNGPIDAWDSSRVIEHRIEQEPGGRVLEIYSDGVLELGQIIHAHLVTFHPALSFHQIVIAGR